MKTVLWENITHQGEKIKKGWSDTLKKIQKHGFPLTRGEVRGLAYSFANQLGKTRNFNNETE